MATQLNHQSSYDASIEDVLSMYADQNFREQVCQAQGALRYDVEISGSETEWTARVERVLPADDLPSFARSVVGDEITVVQTEEWNGGSAAVAIVIPGKPGTGSGRAVLTEAGGTTQQQVSLEIKVSIPLVGGKIEKLISEVIGKALDKEHEIGLNYLS